MLILISPAKTLDYQSPLATERYTQPELLDYSQQLIHEARKLSAPQIASLMSISDKLADLNATRFHEWHPDFTPANARRRFWPSRAMSYRPAGRRVQRSRFRFCPAASAYAFRPVRRAAPAGSDAALSSGDGHPPKTPKAKICTISGATLSPIS